MHKLAILALTAFAAVAATPALAQPYGPGPGYRPGPPPGYGPGYGSPRHQAQCESRIDDGQRRQFCPMDTRGGVHIVQRLSRTPCIRERTFFVAPRGVFVRAGCRAVFATNRFGPRY